MILTMNNTLLNFILVIDNKDLVPLNVYETINNWKGSEDKRDFLVAEIDPEYAGGIELCDKYNVDPKYGANCLVVDGIRGDNHTYAVLLVPVGYRYNMSSVVRKELNARMVSVAPLDFVLEQSGMEYGSITPIGLPKEWVLFIDPLVLENERIIVGGGYKKSKLSIPSKALLSLTTAKVVDGLAKRLN